MKLPFQTLLARVAGAARSPRRAPTTDAGATIERALRQAGLMPDADPTTTGVGRARFDPDATIVAALQQAGLAAEDVTARPATTSPPREPRPVAEYTDLPIDVEWQAVAASAAHVPQRGATRDEVMPQADAFVAGTLATGAGVRRYKLFVPASGPRQQCALVVMLHGCTQDPDDFAIGTRMNALAAEAGAVVLYPEQPARANGSRCWNWFRPGDQRRDAGEPAEIAALTRHIVATHAIDPARVYVAGLSAGGAMAAILGREYPDLYAAIGVHSGLAPGAAHDVASAFAVMKRPAPLKAGPRRADTAPRDRAAAPTPMIVFHGDRDSTVHSDNALHLLQAHVAEAARADVDASTANATRTRYRGADDAVHAEHWVVHGAAHAWSGGDPAGSYTQPNGPDASREMLRFFDRHRLRA